MLGGCKMPISGDSMIQNLLLKSKIRVIHRPRQRQLVFFSISMKQIFTPGQVGGYQCLEYQLKEM